MSIPSVRSVVFFAACGAMLLPVTAHATYSRMVIEDGGGNTLAMQGELTGDYTSITALGNQSAIGKAPVPYVEASATSADRDAAVVSTDLIYSIGLYGATNSLVPVHFTGLFDVDASIFGFGWLMLGLIYGNTTTDLQVTCYGSSANAPSGPLLAGYFLQNATSTAVQGCGQAFFSGVLYVPLDSNGYSSISVSMQAQAIATADQGLWVITPGNAYAYLDPHFEIPDWFLDANPGYSLNVLDGFGNETRANGQSVPEPATLALMGLGLAGLFGVRRKKLIDMGKEG